MSWEDLTPDERRESTERMAYRELERAEKAEAHVTELLRLVGEGEAERFKLRKHNGEYRDLVERLRRELTEGRAMVKAARLTRSGSSLAAKLAAWADASEETD